MPVAPPARVLIADGDPGRVPDESETYLQAALRLGCPASAMEKRRSIRGRSISWGRRKPADLQKTAAVVLANVESLGALDANRLGEFVERGGGLVVFTGDRVGPEGTRGLETAGLGVGHGPRARDRHRLPWRLERWQAGHSIFKPFDDPEHGDLRRPVFTSITRIKPDCASPCAGVVPRW